MADPSQFEIYICSQKRPFRTRRSAKIATKRAKANGKCPKLYVYECPVCGKWHHTKQKQKTHEEIEK